MTIASHWLSIRKSNVTWKQISRIVLSEPALMPRLNS
jgi:hypothetical protein